MFNRLILVLMGVLLSLTAPTGLAQRTPWTTSHLTGTPEPAPPYRAVEAFEKLKFEGPVELVPMPGTSQLVVVELPGRILRFDEKPGTENQEVLLDGKKQLRDFDQIYGIVFDPKFATNHHVYLCFNRRQNENRVTHVARFTMRDEAIDPASEFPLLTWTGGGHNGGSLKFGADGMLYISAGDGAAPHPPDHNDVGQNLTDLRATIMRIDVHPADTTKPYGIPTDNPFIKTPNARPEIWAYGFRNPWRMSFDRSSGELWVGDVGWERWEMIDRVTRGANFGWPIVEGPASTRTDVKPGPTPITLPRAVHDHTEARSITGGFVYRGKQFAKLVGKYIYGDFETGKIWALDPASADSKPVEIADTSFKLVAFGENHDGELYLLDFGGKIHKLQAHPDAGKPSDFPTKLSDTGLFTDLEKLEPAPGVIPYLIHKPLWRNGNTSINLLALPDTKPVVNDKRGFVYPAGTVFAKTILKRRQRLETQVLHFDGLDWHAYAYRWRADQTDADLAPAAGITSDQPGAWRTASRNECTTCHNAWAKTILGFNPAQLNHADFVTTPKTGNPLNQLVRLVKQGTLTTLPPYQPDQWPNMGLDDLNTQARAYLHVHCAHCHRREAGGSAAIVLDFGLSNDHIAAIDQRPTQGDLGLTGARVIAPGDPYHSVLYARLARADGARMPKIGVHETDVEGLKLIHDWIASLGNAPARPTADSALADLQNGKNTDAALTTLLATPDTQLMLQHALDQNRIDLKVRESVIDRAASVAPEYFNRLVPEQRRAVFLGAEPDRAALLAMTGDLKRGEKVFFTAVGGVCATCHRIGDRGGMIGPDLSALGTRAKRDQILEALLDPAAKVEPAFQLHQLELSDGRQIVGFILSQSDQELVLREASGATHAIPIAQLKKQTALPGSLMPTGLLAGLTSTQAADLLAYLASLGR